MARVDHAARPVRSSAGLAREISQSLALLALTGSSVGGLLAMVNIATHALGR